MRTITYFFTLCCIPLLAGAEAKTLDTETAAAVGWTAMGSVLAKADVAIAKSFVCGTTTAKGAFGEASANENAVKFFAEEKMKDWKSITPRIGPQGIDHIFLKFKENGKICGLIIGESKYGSSRLNFTKDGIQLGRGWIKARVGKLAGKYIGVSKVTKVACAPAYPDYKLSVFLKNSKEVFFWKSKKRGFRQWQFGGAPEELAEASKQAVNYGNYLIKVGKGEAKYRPRLYEIKPKGNDVKLTIRDASNIDEVKKQSKLKIIHEETFKNILDKKISPDLKGEIYKQLKSKLKGYNATELEELTDSVAKNLTPKKLLSNYGAVQIAKRYVSRAVLGGLAFVPMDMAMQLSNGRLDLKMSLLSGVGNMGGIVYAQSTQAVLMKSQWIQKIAPKLVKTLGVSSTKLMTGSSLLNGCIVTTAILCYGQYALGYSDLETANKDMLATSVGVATATVAGWGAMATISAFASASTGTAISTLSGAAVTNACLAWIGGGSVAAGGGGAALGGVIFSGGTLLVAIAATSAVYFIYDEYNKEVQWEAVDRHIDFLQANVEKLVDQFWQPREEQSPIKM